MTVETKRFCPKCEKTRAVRALERQETLAVRETPIKTVSSLTECLTCREVFATEAQEEENLRKAYAEYRRQKALLTPEELRQIRATYGLSQASLSRWLGWGEITIQRYEAGGLQDAAHNETLLLLKDPRNARQLLAKYRDNLDAATAANLEKTISCLMESRVAELIKNDLATSLAMAGPSEFNGYRRFDIDRFESLALHVLKKAGPTFKTAMNKFLWYIDFSYFRDQTKSITGSHYLRFQHGPIPRSYDYLFAGMVEKGLVETEEVTFRDFSGERYAGKSDGDMDMFQVSELKVIDACVAALKGRSSKQLSDMAHKETAYVVTKDRELISYRHASVLKFKAAPAKTKAA